MVNYSQPVDSYVPPVNSLTPVAQPDPKLSREAILLIAAVAAGSFLMLWVLFRWRQIARCVRQTTTADEDVLTILVQARALAGLRKNVALRVTEEAMSPAVCGLFKPVILLPRSLIEKLAANQLRAVLLHELIHLRRRDVWVNCAQTLLQIAYWWHPLLWIANARMRRVREEAVDDAVMCALNVDAEVYAPTLLEVAKLAFSRPLASLGLVGILESRNALRHRIERLLNFTTPRRAGVSMVSLICLAAFTALAVPMGEPPARPAQMVTNETGSKQIDKLTANVTESQSNKNSLSENGHPEIPRIYRTNAPLPPPPGPGTNLITFTFQLDPADFARRLTNFATQHNMSWISNQQALLVNFLADDGVTLYPPKSFFLRSDNRALTMHATKEDQQKAAELLGLNRETAMITESPTNLYDYTFRLDETALAQRLKAFAAEHRLKGNLTNPPGLLLYFLSYEGVRLGPPQTSFYRAGALSMRATRENLKKTAVALGFNLDTEQALTASNTIDLKQILADDKPQILIAASEGARTNAGDSAARSKADINNLLLDGEQLFRHGNSDDAASKFKQILDLDPKNETASYFLMLIKRSQATPLQTGGQNLKDPPAGARAMNVPGPDSPPDNAHPNLHAPNANASTNRIFTSAARQKLYEKLQNITFDKVSFADEPLRDVIQELSELTRRRDMDQQGVNYLLNKTKPPTAFTTDAKTVEDIDLATVIISLNAGLRNARLLDVLEAITKSADHPIQYSILDYGIEFSLKGPDELHTRTFKVDPNEFYINLQKSGIDITNLVTGRNATLSASVPPDGNAEGHGLRYIDKLDSGSEIQLALIAFFRTVGVNLAAPKSLFYNSRQSTLTVRATDADLELIEQAISDLNTATPQVTVKARFFEVDPALFATVFTNSSQAGTNVLIGVWAEPALKSLLKTLEAKERGALLNEGQVTTLSGRQASFQIVDVKPVITGLSASVTNNTTQYDYKTTNMTFGTTLDVVSYVEADGYTIQMTLTPKINEFLGFENPKDYVKYDAKLKQAQFPLPKYRSRQTTTSATVWDGQTLVLGNLPDDSVVAEPDGAMLRQPFVDKKKKQLIILVTPTIVDRSGNRVHDNIASASVK